MLYLRQSMAVSLLVCICGLLPAVAQENNDPYDERNALAISQAAVGRVVGNHRFSKRSGIPVSMDELRGRPLVVSLIYTSCYHVCPMLTQHLAKVVGIARETLGDDSFNVLTIGFDTAVDIPERMAQFSMEQSIKDERWFFLSADSQVIDALTEDLGFIYFASPKGFDHLTQTTVIDADGRVYRQIYGQKFDTPSLVEPLKELVYNSPRDLGLVDAWIDNVRLFCTIYDPKTGRYKFDYSIFVTIFAGVVSLGAIAVFIIHASRNVR
ncbi:MAG: SCO family protein [Gammaproteobacteria bacterium]|nr:SCO family protein [Gammaproteobacteria bacterium]